MRDSTELTQTGFMPPDGVQPPKGLRAAMEGLAREVLLKSPTDILAFAADYFEQLVALRNSADSDGKISNVQDLIIDNLKDVNQLDDYCSEKETTNQNIDHENQLTNDLVHPITDLTEMNTEPLLKANNEQNSLIPNLDLSRNSDEKSQTEIETLPIPIEEGPRDSFEDDNNINGLEICSQSNIDINDDKASDINLSRNCDKNFHPEDEIVPIPIDKASYESPNRGDSENTANNLKSNMDILDDKSPPNVSLSRNSENNYQTEDENITIATEETTHKSPEHGDSENTANNFEDHNQSNMDILDDKSTPNVSLSRNSDKNDLTGEEHVPIPIDETIYKSPDNGGGENLTDNLEIFDQSNKDIPGDSHDDVENKSNEEIDAIQVEEMDDEVFLNKTTELSEDTLTDNHISKSSKDLSHEFIVQEETESTMIMSLDKNPNSTQMININNDFITNEIIRSEVILEQQIPSPENSTTVDDEAEPINIIVDVHEQESPVLLTTIENSDKNSFIQDIISLENIKHSQIIQVLHASIEDDSKDNHQELEQSAEEENIQDDETDKVPLNNEDIEADELEKIAVHKIEIIDLHAENKETINPQEKILDESQSATVSESVNENELSEPNETINNVDEAPTLKDIENENNLFEKASIMIQRVFRGFQVRTKLNKRKPEVKAVDSDEITAQAEFNSKGNDTNIKVIKADSALYTVPEEKNASYSTEEESSTFSSAATKIQAGVRGFLTRKYFQQNKTNNSSDTTAPSIGEDSRSLDDVANTTADETVHKIIDSTTSILIEQLEHFEKLEQRSARNSISIIETMDISKDVDDSFDRASQSRKRLRREDAIQLHSPFSSGENPIAREPSKLSEDDEPIGDLAQSIISEIVSNTYIPPKETTHEDFIPSDDMDSVEGIEETYTVEVSPDVDENNLLLDQLLNLESSQDCEEIVANDEPEPLEVLDHTITSTKNSPTDNVTIRQPSIMSDDGDVVVAPTMPRTPLHEEHETHITMVATRFLDTASEIEAPLTIEEIDDSAIENTDMQISPNKKSDIEDTIADSIAVTETQEDENNGNIEESANDQVSHKTDHRETSSSPSEEKKVEESAVPGSNENSIESRVKEEIQYRGLVHSGEFHDTIALPTNVERKATTPKKDAILGLETRV